MTGLDLSVDEELSVLLNHALITIETRRNGFKAVSPHHSYVFTDCDKIGLMKHPDLLIPNRKRDLGDAFLGKESWTRQIQ